MTTTATIAEILISDLEQAVSDRLANCSKGPELEAARRRLREALGVAQGVLQRGEPVAYQYRTGWENSDVWTEWSPADKGQYDRILRNGKVGLYRAEARALYASPPAQLPATWQPIETASERIRGFAKLLQHTIPRGPVVQLGGSLEDGSLYLFGHHAITHEVQQWLVIPALYCRPMDALSLSSTNRANADAFDRAQGVMDATMTSAEGE